MSDPDIIDAERTGGCQCGAVRFSVSMAPLDVSYCHCRMCQRAVGNLFAALVMIRKDHVEWTKGAPAVFESSSAAERVPAGRRCFSATRHHPTSSSRSAASIIRKC
jgi:hypothetical protein